MVEPIQRLRPVALSRLAPITAALFYADIARRLGVSMNGYGTSTPGASTPRWGIHRRHLIDLRIARCHER
jgi:hypothetical protein